jgi:hypothetical protein
LILQAYRPGTEDTNDPYFAEALQEMARNPQLSRWFTEEQAFDQAMTGQLAAVPAPFGLKTRILAHAAPPARSQKLRWAAGLAALAALLFLLAQVVSLWRSPAPASAALADYTHAMINFIQPSVTLAMESQDIGAIKNWLAKKEPRQVEIPPHLAALQPLGCSILSFHGHDVTLICFLREENQAAHLFVVDRAVLPKLKPGEAPVFSGADGWTTASWAEKDRVYTIAVQGDRTAVEPYLPRA